MGTDSSSNREWQAVGKIAVSSLPDARIQLHWASQIVASFGNAVLEKRKDDSQSNLGWVDGLGTLCSRASSGEWSVGLRLADLTLLFLNSDHTIQSQFGCSGQTLQQGFDWLTSTYTKLSGSAPPKPFALREYDMPPHPAAQGTPFSLRQVAPFQEFHDWYGNANAAIHDLSSQWKQASPIRCWPHHFDLATLVTLDSGKASEEARSVGCGMSPGDGTYNEPYFYVTPWPYPKEEQLSTLPVGFWHTKGWIGAILTASDLIQKGAKDTQAERVRQFFQAGTDACFTALGTTPS